METGQHHPDHERYLKDCEELFGQRVHTVQSKKYSSAIDVCLQDKYVNGPAGARCTLKLKKELRWHIEKITKFDFQVFGFEYQKKEINRAIRFEQQYPDAKAVFPLIELKMNKEDCMRELMSHGIELPAMYKLGYSNSNCIGCVKGGMGYWNKIRQDFPEIFKRTAEMERTVGRSCIKGKFLDELDPEAGRHTDISLPQCGVVCPTELDGLKILTDPKLIERRLFGYDKLEF